MTDNELRALRDANRKDEVLVNIINRIIRSRRNLVHIAGLDAPDRKRSIQDHIDHLLERVSQRLRKDMTVVSH